MDSSMDASSLFDAEDNAFYEQLTRQILMLTDEDDDDTCMYRRTVAVRKPVAHGYGGSKLEPMKYYSWSDTGRCSVPSWMESLWAKGGGGGSGTGVFIPAARSIGKKSGRRRYNNKARKDNDRGRMYSTNGQKIHG